MSQDIPIPFPRLKYEDAMNRYGCDKPDVRFDMEIKDISDIVEHCDFKVFSQVVKNGGTVRAINAKGGAAELPRKEVDSLIEIVKPYRAKGLAWIQVAEDGLKSPIVKFMSEVQVNDILTRLDAEVGDLLLFVADKESVVFPSLAHLRLHMGKRLGMIDEDALSFVWVTEFPVFEYDETEKRFSAMHHPFTAPMDEDIDLLETAPEKARAKAYDLVLNGVELGGGSIRIHDRSLQEKMFTALGFTKEQAEEQFGFLLEAFKYGTPPHGGIAYGLDRMLMLMTQSTSIRDVIAFPKVQNASDPMTEAPSRVSSKQLEELSLRIVEDEE
jgi:aspartyl-tRNA synthetase